MVYGTTSNMKKTWAFDFDGTIADTYDIFYEAFRNACLQSGIASLSPEIFLNIFEGNMFDGLCALGLNKEKIPAFMERLKTGLAPSESAVSLFPEMGETLNKLGEKHPVYVITANDSSVVRNILETHSVHSIRAVLGGDVEISKVVKLEKLQKQHPDHTLHYVGDTCGDMTEAHHAGAKAIAVSWGWHSPARLQKSKPDQILQNPADILRG